MTRAIEIDDVKSPHITWLRILSKLRGNTFRDTWKLYEYSRLARSVAAHLDGVTTLVDFGCGEGLFTRELKKQLPKVESVVAVDLAPNASWAIPMQGIRFVVGDASSPPTGLGRPDGVVAKDLLHHMTDPRVGIRTIVNTATTRALVIEANRENPIMAMYTQYNGDKHLTPAELKQMLELAAPGITWQISSVVAYPFYLPPVRSLAAAWVWPITGLMLLAFKVARSEATAKALSQLLNKRNWPPPYTIAVANLPAWEDQ